MRTGRYLLVLLLAAAAAPVRPAPDGQRSYETGRLIEIGINGHGTSQTRSSRTGADLWWTYCICTPETTYYAVSRTRPDGLGVVVNGTVRIRRSRSLLYLLDSKGKRHTLRISREKSDRSCELAPR